MSGVAGAVRGDGGRRAWGERGSGPEAGLHHARQHGLDHLITVDMGGTSFDITLTKDGSTNINKNIDFLRYRIGVPMIQVETLGAGGGSITSNTRASRKPGSASISATWCRSHARYSASMSASRSMFTS